MSSISLERRATKTIIVATLQVGGPCREEASQNVFPARAPALFIRAFLFDGGSLDGVMGFLPSCGRCRLVLPLTAGQEECQTQHLLAPALFFEMPCACFQ